MKREVDRRVKKVFHQWGSNLLVIVMEMMKMMMSIVMG